MKYKLSLLCILTSFFCYGQIPLVEIEGTLSVYLPEDTTSIHIGRKVGINTSSPANYNTVVGSEAGGNSSGFNQNSLFGYRAGYYSETYNNSFFGYLTGEMTGKTSSGGCCNSFFGAEAGRDNESGGNNSFFGEFSGYHNISGSYNAYFGGYSGEDNNGSYNSYFGHGSGEGSDNGNYNSFFGSESGMNSNGNYNNYFGYRAGYLNSTGERNVAIGANALRQAKQKNDNVAIGDSAMYGIGIIDENTFFGQQNVAIGTRAFYGVDSEFGRNSVAIGYEAGMDGGQRSIFIGHQAGKNIVGIDDVLYINNTSGDAPLIYGEFDNDYLQINGNLESTGKLSVGTTPGNWKVAVRETGNAKDGSNVDVSNLAMMLEKQNPATNEAVGLGFKSSSDNTDVGAAIIHEKTSNFSKGKLHFATKTTSVAGADIPIHMTIDEEGFLGVGTENPDFKTVIKETGNALSGDNVDISNLALVFEKASNLAGQGIGIGFQSSSTPTTIGGAILFERTGAGSKGHLHFATKQTDGADEDIPIRMTIEDFGNVGIGTTDPEVTLDVQGTIRGTTVFCGGINACSDMRLKRDFALIKSPLAMVKNLTGYFHFWNQEEHPDWQFSDQRAIGFKAQEVEKVLPEVVDSMPDGYLAVDYGKLVPLLVEAIKEQQATIEKQQVQIQYQSTELSLIKSELAQIKQLFTQTVLFQSNETIKSNK